MIINDLSNTNINSQQSGAIKQGNLLTPSKTETTVNAFEKAMVSASSPMSSTDVSRTSYGELTEGINSVEDALKVNAQVAKDNLKALFNKLSGAETEELNENGFDINDMEDEELLDVVDRIKIMLAAYNENFQAFAGALNMPDEAVIAQDGNLAAKVADSLVKNNMPATDSNITEVMGTVHMAKDVCENAPLSDEAKAYMIENEAEPTIENLYKANHSTVNNGYVSGITEDMWQQLMPQAQEIIDKAGIYNTPEEKTKALDAARWLIDNELPITEENIANKLELDELELVYNEEAVITGAVLSLYKGENAANVYADDTEDTFTMATKAIGTIINVSYSEVEAIITNERPFTIEEMAARLKNRSVDIKEPDTKSDTKSDTRENADTSAKVNAAYHTVLEARVLMSASSVVAIINKGIDIYNEDLNTLVDLLHETEIGNMIKDFSDNNAGSISEEELTQVINTNEALLGLRFMPAAAIGYVAIEQTTEVTISAVYESGTSYKRQYEAAGQTYEAMSTQIRADMGDSLKQAVDNSADNILLNMGMENTEVNKRAVRILSANNMDVTPENIIAVKQVDSTVNNLMENMNPQVVLDMIRDDINPMETDLDVLNRYIEENYDTEADVAKYSEFLYKLENTEGISEDERKQYIGIYKMFNMFKKDAGKAIGALVNEGAAITLSNMVSAVQSRSKLGMDAKITAETGMAQISGTVSYYDNLFSKLGKDITPSMLKEVDNTEGLSDISLEKLQELAANYKENAENADKEIYEKQAEDIRNYNFADTDEDIIRLLTDNNIPVSFYNIMSANQLATNSKVYNSIYTRADEKIQQDMENILDALDNEESIQEAYDTLNVDEKEAIAKAITTDDSENIDEFSQINQMKNSSKVIELAAALSKTKNYFIPFKLEDQMGTINLKIVNEDNDQSRMAMTFTTAELGNVYAQFDFDKTSMAGYVVSDKEEAKEIIKESLVGIEEAIKTAGFEDSRIIVSHSDEVPEIHLNETKKRPTNAAIYKVAKEILTKLIKNEAN